MRKERARWARAICTDLDGWDLRSVPGYGGVAHLSACRREEGREAEKGTRRNGAVPN